MNPSTYHHSSLSNGFTEHEALTLLRGEEIKHQEKQVKAELLFRAADADVTFAEDELDAALEDENEQLGTISTYDNPTHKYKVYGQAYLKSLMESVSKFWLTLLAILMLAIGGLVIPAIDAAMFYNLFSADFENQFGELSNSQAWLVILFSLQALATFVAAKFFVTTPERRAKLAIVVFALGILFAVGASLEQAHDKMISHQLANSEAVISWDNSAPSQTQSEISWSAYISSYLLSLGFIALPLLGALLLSLGWDTFITSRLGLKKAKHFRQIYKAWKQAVKKRNEAEVELILLIEYRETIIRKPLDNKISSIIRGQRGQVGAAHSVVQSRLYGLIGLPNPNDPINRIKNADGVAETANKQIAEYGGDYSDRMIDKWKAEKPPK